MESVTTSSQLINLKSSLVALASLWHDAGKYSDNLTVNDPLSHEWVSCLLFFAYIKSVGAKCDQDWLSALQASSFDAKKVISIVSSLKNPENFLELSPDSADGWKNFPVALFVAWLILSHHSLPAAKATSKYCSNFADCSISDLNSLFEIVTAQMGYSNCDEKKDVLSFTPGLVFSNKMWQEENAKWAKELENHIETLAKLCEHKCFYEVLMTSRLAMNLGDYQIRKAEPNLSLDEHLLKVADYAVKVIEALPAFENLPEYKDERYNQNVYEPIKDGLFIFRDEKYRGQVESLYGVTGVLRCTLLVDRAMGQLQARRCMADTWLKDYSQMAAVLDGAKQEDEFGVGELLSYTNVGKDQKLDELLADGKLACALGAEGSDCDYPVSKQVLDYLVPAVLIAPMKSLLRACDATSSLKYVVPLLRMMGSDLVISNFNDFTESELMALSRLAYLCGVFGRRCLLSSATMSTEEVESLAYAYTKGWKEHAFLHGKRSYVVFDFSRSNEYLCKTDASTFERFDRAFRIGFRGFERARKEAYFSHLSIHELLVGKDFYGSIANGIKTLYRSRMHFDRKTGAKVTFGYIRLNTADQCIALSRYLNEHGLGLADKAGAGPAPKIRTLTYHPGEVQEIRDAQEEYLYNLFACSKSSKDWLNDPEVRTRLDGTGAASGMGKAKRGDEFLFLVITPYDLDYNFDWGIYEPCRTFKVSLRHMSGHRSSEYLHETIINDKKNPKGITAEVGVLEKSLSGVSIEDCETPIPVKPTDNPKVQDFTSFVDGAAMLTNLPQKLHPFIETSSVGEAEKRP